MPCVCLQEVTAAPAARARRPQQRCMQEYVSDSRVCLSKIPSSPARLCRCWWPVCSYAVSSYVRLYKHEDVWHDITDKAFQYVGYIAAVFARPLWSISGQIWPKLLGKSFHTHLRWLLHFSKRLNVVNWGRKRTTSDINLWHFSLSDWSALYARSETSDLNSLLIDPHRSHVTFWHVNTWNKWKSYFHFFLLFCKFNWSCFCHATYSSAIV